MKTHLNFLFTAAGTVGLAVLVGSAIADQPIETVITLGDNNTQLVIPGLESGKPLDRPHAFQVADKFMDVWRKDHPGSNWIMAQNNGPKDLAMQVRTAQPPPQTQGGVYSTFDKSDEMIWKS